MKKCDHCDKPALVTFDTEARPKKPSVYIGGLCEEHDTQENQDAIVKRWSAN